MNTVADDLAVWARQINGDGPETVPLNGAKCDCAAIAPTMPVFRTEHLPTCPMSIITILARDARAYRELLPVYQAVVIDAEVHRRVCKRSATLVKRHSSPEASE